MNTNDLNPQEKTEFHLALEITRNITFEVAYYTLGSNKNAHFTTSASELNRPKSDYKQCGQAQESLLTGAAKIFYDKWDTKKDLHLSDLTEEEYTELVFDLGVLELRYNSLMVDNRIDHIPFYKIVELSKQIIKPKPKLVRV